MAIFDSLISEVAEKFGFGNKAGGLLAGLLSLITSSNSGGLTGLISRFSDVGLGNVVNSWISKGENTALTTDQLFHVFGNETISNLAGKAGISTAAATPALAYMLPKVVNSLTPDGVVPTSLPATVMNYVSGLGGMLGKGAGTVASGAAGVVGAGAGVVGAGAAAVGAGLAGAAGAVGSGLKGATILAGDTAKSGMSGWLRLLPLLLLLLVTFLGYRYCSNAPEDQIAKSTDAAATVAAAATATASATAIPVVAPPAGPLNPGAAVTAAAAAASSALAGLKPGFTADELVKALNLEIINFASGTNGIPKENEELLRKSADMIKQAPTGTELIVGGHTDNKGTAAGNLALSQKRAEAVKAFLVKNGVKAEVLTAEGYGAAKSVASNETEEGRFKNRRIEFSVAK